MKSCRSRRFSDPLFGASWGRLAKNCDGRQGLLTIFSDITLANSV